MSDWAQSPFIVPIGAFAAWVAVVAIKTSARFKTRELQSRERLAAIEKGIPVADELPEPENGRRNKYSGPPATRVAKLRTGGITNISLGIGLVFFFMVLSHVLRCRPVLSGAAAGLIPLAIGIGLLIDSKMQAKTLAANPTTPVEPPPPSYPTA